MIKANAELSESIPEISAAHVPMGMLRFRPAVLGLTLRLMNRLFFMLVICTVQVFAGSWLDLHQRNDPGQISQDMRNLATMVSVPRQNFLRNFGQVSFTQSILSTRSGLSTQNQQVGFAIQPLPEWIFSGQLWNLPARYPVFGYSCSGNYIWSRDNRVEWSSEVQLNQISGQRTFSQKNVSLTQHYLRINPQWFVGLATTYNLEHTLYSGAPGVRNRDRNYWILSGNIGKSFFNALQLAMNISAQNHSVAGSMSINWGIGN